MLGSSSLPWDEGLGLLWSGGLTTCGSSLFLNVWEQYSYFLADFTLPFLQILFFKLFHQQSTSLCPGCPSEDMGHRLPCAVHG